MRFSRLVQLRRGRLLGAVIVGLVLMLSTVAFGSSASAKTVPGAITKVTVAPQQAGARQVFRTSIDWCVPNGTVNGDTFTLTLPIQLAGAPSPFPLKDPAGAVVANATVSNTSPAVVTFTLTAYAQQHQSVCGTAFFQSSLSSSAYQGSTQTFTYTTNDGSKFSTPVTIASAPDVNRGQARKWGRFQTNDDCRTVATDCITWVVETPVGPSTGGTITDTVATPQLVDCSKVQMLIGDSDPAFRSGEFNHGVPYTTFTSTCTTSGLTVTYLAVPAGKLLQLRIPTSLPAPDAAGGMTYVNPSASVIDNPPGAPVRSSVGMTARITSALAGGDGVGINPAPAVKIVKQDAAGHAADTAAAAVDLGYAPAATGLVFTITNTGIEPLVNVAVTDAVIANGTVTGLSCTFPNGAKGTTWPGPFAVGASFGCTAQLSGVKTGTAHEDMATVAGTGQFSGIAVTSHNAYFATAKGSVCVGDRVWIDTNHNGIQDTGEVGLAGVTMTLTGANGLPVTDITGKVVGATTTNSAGNYLFCKLPAGQYIVHLTAATVPSQYVPTLTGKGTRATDSSTGSSESLVLTAGESDLSLDFGFWAPAGLSFTGPSGSGLSFTGPPGSGASLPNTGVAVGGQLLGALALGLLGGLLIFAGRRRSQRL